jgi:mannose-6-phosphate isomerase-like protein (cupin superfamily)
MRANGHVWSISFKRKKDFSRFAVELGPGEFLIVPRGVEHRTAAEEEAEVIVFEPAATRNTGDVVDPIFTAPNGVRV